MTDLPGGSPLLKRILPAIPEGEPVYLVGGAVRDLFLHRVSHDLDFALPGNALKLARKVGDSLGGAYFPLDEARDTGRVVLEGDLGERVVLDFTGFRGPDLESDLRARDLTINSLALDLHQPDKIIDPLGGIRDLQHGLLRPCSPESFTSDPLRILRTIRMAVDFEFRILPETRDLIQGSLSGLAEVSPERIRDELFTILDTGSPATGVQLLDHFRVLPFTFPELLDLKDVRQPPPHIYEVWKHTLATLRQLDRVLGVLGPVHDEEASADLMMGLLVQRIGRYREQISAHLEDQPTPDRSLRSLLSFAALYHDIGKPTTKSIDESGRIRFLAHADAGAEITSARARQLCLSNREIQRAVRIVRHHMRPLNLAASGKQPSRRAVYRFFRDTGAAGVDICLLSLADTLATYGPALKQDVWLQQLDIVRALLEGWWEQRETRIRPEPLIGGKDLIEELNLAPGPQFGELLDFLLEAQAVGEIKTRQEALDRAKQWLRGQEP
ncbi:MAG: HD domain-containing protein [Anaerolineales bacterium]|nr:HD domain-containing protein [Anaerolineales bacterium]